MNYTHYYILKHGPTHVVRFYVVRFPGTIPSSGEEKIIILGVIMACLIKVYGEAGKFQEGTQAIETMTEAKTNLKTPTASKGLSPNDLAVLALQEVIRYFWLGIHDLGLLCMVSVRIRQLTRNGRVWRRVVRSMFPKHPFEVNVVGVDAFVAEFVLFPANYFFNID